MEQNNTRKLRAILFIDIVGYTRLMEVDENRARLSIRKFRDEVRQKVKSSRGEIINFMGDGCLCIFESSVNAMTCAVDLQHALREDPVVPVRIGLHSGDVYFEDDNVYGDSVNIASRIESMGVAGTILFSQRIKDDIKNQDEFLVSSLGKFEFKHVEESLEVYALSNDGMTVPKRHEIEGKLKPIRPVLNISRKTGFGLLLGAICIAILATVVSKTDGFWNKAGIESPEKSTIAVLNFDNNTGSDEFDMLGKMVADRIVYGITQNELASVITGESIEEYNLTSDGSKAMTGQMNFLTTNFEVGRAISGDIYREGEELLFECSISDTRTGEIMIGLPSVRCPSNDPFKGIEELRQLVLGTLAAGNDRELNLTLESNPPKFEAYKELMLAKDADKGEDMLQHLNNALAIDSTYYEPKLLRISHYYNIHEYVIADSLTNVLNANRSEFDSRQKNLLSFYIALLKGQNNLIYKHMNDELEIAPFDLMTNVSVIVLAVQFTNNIERGLEVYEVIPEDDLDYANCERCRLRLYMKMYIDIELKLLEGAVETGKRLIKSGGVDLADAFMVRAYVRLKKWNDLEDYMSTNLKSKVGNISTIHLLEAAKECLLIKENEKALEYAQRANDRIDPDLSSTNKGEIFLLLDRLDTAEMWFQIASDADSSDFTSWSLLAGTKYLQGKTSEADGVIAQMEGFKQPYQFGDIDYKIARALMMSGDRDGALDKLKRSVVEGQHYGFFYFQNDFHLVELQEDPAFKELMHYWD